MKGNYNNIAAYYDRLSKFVFGYAIVNAQKYLLQFLKANSAVLIIGGGTGWLLEEVTKLHAEGLHVTYVELSERMISISKTRWTGDNKVIFVNQAIQDVKLSEQFDIVITPFFLDNFSFETADTVISKIDRCLVPGALWLFSDFQITTRSRFWQKALLKIMYLFFKVFCHIEAYNLPDTAILFRKYQYENVASKSFFANFICSIVYEKAGAEN